MSLFGALYTGVSALTAQSQSVAIISNNISNVSTTGFKRSEAAFFSLVTSQSRASLYSPGTVAVNRQQRVDQQGPIQQTSSTTDVAVSGNGFFPVKRDTSDEQEFLFTRNGSFHEDSQGFLKNTAGFYLYGWPLDADGNLPASQGDQSSLVPVDIAFLGGLTRPTTTAELSINLDADQSAYNVTLPVSGASPAHFSRGLRVYDSLGAAQDITMEFRKVLGPMANATSTAFNMELDTPLIGATLPGMAAGNQFTITVGAATQQYTVVAGTPATVPGDIQTVGDLINQINSSFGGGGVLEARLDSQGHLVLQANDPAANITVTDDTGTPFFGANRFNFTDTGAAGTETYTPLTIGTTYTGQSDFPDFFNTLSPNTQGWWEVSVVHPNGTNISQGLLNFNGDGTLNASPDSNGLIDISLTSVDWGNGSDPQTISVDVERFSQFSGNYNVIFSDQNGAELGLRTGVEIDREGQVTARFSNGATAILYKVPLITFANTNGLNEVSGTAYSKSEESGEENLREAGSGGAGFLESSTIEGSNVDLADEFSRLIVSQRAYSAGTKTISTVDQMTEELLRLR